MPFNLSSSLLPCAHTPGIGTVPAETHLSLPPNLPVTCETWYSPRLPFITFSPTSLKPPTVSILSFLRPAPFPQFWLLQSWMKEGCRSLYKSWIKTKMKCLTGIFPGHWSPDLNMCWLTRALAWCDRTVKNWGIWWRLRACALELNCLEPQPLELARLHTSWLCGLRAMRVTAALSGTRFPHLYNRSDNRTYTLACLVQKL